MRHSRTFGLTRPVAYTQNPRTEESRVKTRNQGLVTEPRAVEAVKEWRHHRLQPGGIQLQPNDVGEVPLTSRRGRSAILVRLKLKDRTAEAGGIRSFCNLPVRPKLNYHAAKA